MTPIVLLDRLPISCLSGRVLVSGNTLRPVGPTPSPAPLTDRRYQLPLSSRGGYQAVSSAQLKARQLLRQAMRPLAAAGQGRARQDLSPETVDHIYHRSRSVINFATNLMTHLFDHAELLSCLNVYGRHYSSPFSLKHKGLDERRVNIIKRAVQEKAGSGREIWPCCVKAMNDKINLEKRRANRPTKTQ